jgi:protein O-GlcNAc transferase
MSPHDQTVASAAQMAQSGNLQGAAAALQQVISLEPGHAEANRVLGLILFQTGQTAQGLSLVERAMAGAPHRADLHFMHGSMLAWMGQLDRAIATLRAGLDKEPRNAQALALLATCYMQAKDLDRAEDTYRAALDIEPSHAEARTNYAAVLNTLGRTREAIPVYRETVRIHPGHIGALTNYAVALNYADDVDPEEVFRAHEQYGRALMSLPGQPQAQWPNPRDPEKKLRVGIVSPDLWEHSVGYFVRGLLESRDRSRVEYFIYATAARNDAAAQRIAAAADATRDMSRANDQQLLQQIRSDGLDILLELSGQTQGNKLSALRLRGAPVQATYIGYPNTTGVPTIDYRIVDGLTDPPGAERLATEKLVRLDPCFLCYTPPQQAPELSPPPCTAQDFVTFGSFNALKKISPTTVALWAGVLHAVPRSRLVIKAGGLESARAKDHLCSMLKREGIPEVRFDLLGKMDSKSDHLGAYSHVDVGLDSFPYHGTTTTCEAMWMGVPVVSRVGNVHAARVGLSLLSAVGLRELAVESDEAFVSAAKRLADDPARLRELRGNMRLRMSASPLCDGTRFARRFEAALREMWRMWCSGS